ncbi:unnamed protein product [Rotaria sordida]|uniref:Uncharacterized protein n=1 Tax=Rotaria sordida TaxID=392033 RepID=A0A818II09_9BILA|nr:unnamed protein product [Rotaria sordida]CAF3524823.1 unnamed protein product [Rotaria sordida]
MATQYRTFDSGLLQKAWFHLNEYHDFYCMARYRKKIEEQLRNANIPLTYVPWKSMVRTLLCQSLFSDKQLKEMNVHTDECCTEVDIASSQACVNFLLDNSQQDEKSLTETWFEINELKECFQKAINILPANRHARKEMLYKILGYPTGYSEEETDYYLNNNNDESLDLTSVLSIDEQYQMHTGDLIEFSGNRLHDAFYIYRLPKKGIWAQIQQMWSKHQITNFIFNNTVTDPKEEEIILVPAMDEYGYGVPYLFATRPTELLPDGALHKYVDINCPLVSMHKQNPTIALVQQHLNERLKNPVYQDKYMNVEMSVELDRFPQEYVAFVHINDAPKDNVLWVQRVHYNGKEIARDLNDNLEIFFSRRILESEEQYKEKQKFNISSH